MNSENTELAEDAQKSLAELGQDAISPILARLPTLGVFAQRCALDLLERSPSEVLSQVSQDELQRAIHPLLDSTDEVVREWSANVLGRAKSRASIPILRHALKKSRERGIPPDWTEPVAMRSALTDLGDRIEIIPRLLQETCRHEFARCWPAQLLPNLIEALAEEQQILLYFTTWQPHGDAWCWVDSPSWEISLHGPWPDQVQTGKKHALDAIKTWQAPEMSVISLEWIAETDL